MEWDLLRPPLFSKNACFSPVARPPPRPRHPPGHSLVVGPRRRRTTLRTTPPPSHLPLAPAGCRLGRNEPRERAFRPAALLGGPAPPRRLPGRTHAQRPGGHGLGTTTRRTARPPGRPSPPGRARAPDLRGFGRPASSGNGDAGPLPSLPPANCSKNESLSPQPWRGISETLEAQFQTPEDPA
jgi:hypothetical protein